MLWADKNWIGVNRDIIIYELNGDKYKTPLLNECLAIIRLYLKNLINSLRESGEWKTHLSAKILFRSSKDIDENPNKYF